jgi:hypothetical protein
MNVSKKISSGKLKYESVLTYNSNETKEIYLIGSNSANYFYMVKGNNNVQITPISSIKILELKKEIK